MSTKRSSISWCDYSGSDANFVIRGRTAGDCEVSPGCANCYAGAILRRSGQTPEVTTTYPDKLARLARWKFTSVWDTEPYRRGHGSRPLVFVCDMGDLFHPNVPDTFIEQALDVMAARSDVDWQVLTKRAERMAEIGQALGWPSNVWAMVTVENQKAADERIPYLLQVPARVRGLSCEPLLEPLDLSNWFWCNVSWIIVGGESGPKRRPFDVRWAGTLRHQCERAGVAFFFKQAGGRFPGMDATLDGKTIQEFPV